MQKPSDAEYVDALYRTKLDAYTHRAFTVLQPGTPFEHNWHIDCVCEHLHAVYEGQIPRLIINEPPRSLKSVKVAQVYPTWVQGHQPWHQFIGASYASKLMKRNVMNSRKIIQSDWYKGLFPGTVLETEAAEHYTTTKNGQYMGAGITGSATGFGCDTLLLDDILNPQEAASDTMRNSTLENMRNTFFSRYNDERTAKTIMIMQRVHDDDPTGNLMRDQGWHLLKLPAEFVKKTIIQCRGREWIKEPGELLFEGRLSKTILAQKKIDLGSYNYSGQYDQEPVPLGGGDFKQEWVQFYPAGSVKPKEMNIAIIVDQAGSEELNKKKKKLSDWTAILVIGLASDNNYYVLDIIRDRFNPTERIDTIFMVHRHWNELTGKPPRVGCEQIGLATDAHYLREKQNKDAYRFPVIPLGNQIAEGGRFAISKEERIRKLIPILEARRWYMPGSLTYLDLEGRKWDLVKEFTDVELKTFPKSRYDDMVDCASRILDPELGMLFPKQKIGTVAKARREYANASQSDNWENW